MSHPVLILSQIYECMKMKMCILFTWEVWFIFRRKSKGEHNLTTWVLKDFKVGQTAYSKFNLFKFWWEKILLKTFEKRTSNQDT